MERVMDRSEAIDILVGVIATNSEEENEALDLAIEALSESQITLCKDCVWEKDCTQLVSQRDEDGEVIAAFHLTSCSWGQAEDTIEVLGVAENATTTDCISREATIVMGMPSCNHTCNQKQVTSKLETAETATSDGEESTMNQPKSKLDCISRADAIAYIDRILNSGLGKNKSLDYIRKYISALPSAETHEIRTETHGVCLDCISRQDAIEALEHIHIPTQAQREYAVEIFDKIPPVTPTDQTIKEIMDFIGGMNMVDEISNEAYTKISVFVDDGTPTERVTETMIVDGMETEIDPLSYEVGYTHGQFSERLKGEWIDTSEGTFCSECDFKTNEYYNYCPNCNADMRGEGND